MQVRYENRDFQPIHPRIISQTIQDRAMVTVECVNEFVCNLSNGAVFSDCEEPYNLAFNVTILFNGKCI